MEPVEVPMRRLVLCTTLCALLSAHAPAAASPAEPDMRRPLDWLVAAQNDDGSWGDGAKDPHPEIAINPPGTLPQRKLGRNIDTFVAAQFLAEVLPTLRGPLQARAERALGSVVRRIERAQGKDGSYSRDGWAPLLASAFANNGLYAAQRAGAAVDKDVLANGQAGLVGKYDDKTKSFGVADAAGVQLYSVAASMIAAEQVARSDAPASPELKRRAEEARKAATAQLSNENVLRGFGTYGGEEWAGFRKSIRARLAAIQRENGTWRGDHCITSTTFCTAASLITLAIEPRTGGRPS